MYFQPTCGDQWYRNRIGGGGAEVGKAALRVRVDGFGIVMFRVDMKEYCWGVERCDIRTSKDC